ncbi:MAG: beta-eliminating lyase-related protein [Gammaproteobacteria bacterium]
MPQRGFASDNASGVHPRVLEAIAAANRGHALAYGNDPWTADAIAAVRSAFDCDAEVLFCFGGTGANVVALGALTQRHEAVLCTDCAHIWNDECAAPEHFLGGKLIPVPSHQGKLTPAALAPWTAPGRGVHHAPPRVLSLTQPTEWGTLYTPDELRELCTFAHEHGWWVHVDGARFANAAAALGLSLAALGPGCGVDVLSFGGTKNGLLGAEAVVFFDPRLGAAAAWTRKQSTQLASKMRFLAAQFSAYLEDELWRELATHANTMARRAAAGLDGVIRFAVPVEVNMLFPRLPAAAITPLAERFEFHVWDAERGIARWLTSFDTTSEDVDALVAAVRAASA